MIHGKYSTYVHQRCRCTRCRAASARYGRGRGERIRLRRIHASMHGSRAITPAGRSVFVVNTWFGAYALRSA